MRKSIGISIAAALLAFAGLEGYASLRRFRQPAETIPTTRVKEGSVALNVFTTGALTAERIANLVAPRISGSSLTIIKLLPEGTEVKAGEVVLAFDPSAEEYNLEQAQAKRQEADQQMIEAKDNTAVQESQDRSDLLSDRYEVEKAELVVKTNPLLSAIDAKKNVLALDQAKRALAELEADVKSHAETNQATLAVDEQNRQKALFAIQQAQTDIKNLTVRSPIDGAMDLKQNYWAVGGFFTPGMQIPRFHVGDSAYSGVTVGEVIDPGQLEVRASVDESDRGDIRIGQSAQIQVDSLPGKTFDGKIQTISGFASNGGIFADVGAVPTFSLTIRFTGAGANLHPGDSVHIVISGNPIAHALSVPPQAIFQQYGNPVVFIRQGGKFVAQRVKIRYRTASETVVQGVASGTVVALADPRKKQAGGSGVEAGPATPFPGGG
jgi:HlyD family secretion protein